MQPRGGNGSGMANKVQRGPPAVHRVHLQATGGLRGGGSGGAGALAPSALGSNRFGMT